MTTKTLNFEDTRSGITNRQEVHLDGDMIHLADDKDRIQIMITIDENGSLAIDTSIHTWGIDDINELAEFLVNLGHQIGHDLGHQCAFNAHAQAAEAAAGINMEEVIGGLLAGLEKARQETTRTNPESN